jgi:hypothetical protein
MSQYIRNFMSLDAENQPSHIFHGRCRLRGGHPQPDEIVQPLEVSMSERTFESPVFVRAAQGLVQEVACLEDARDFLHEWPRHRRGVIHETATRACHRAFDGLVALRAARDAFAGFARSAKILEDVSVAMPWMAGPKASEIGGVAA